MSVAPDPHAPVRRAGKSATAFRTISEVATELDLPQHVLRFWESKFPQIKPMKRGGGRRYYRPADMDLLRRIRALLYDDGYTIKGVQKILRDQNGRNGGPLDDDPPANGGAAVPDEAKADAAQPNEPALGDQILIERRVLRELLAELEAIRRML